jgi:hypothetical protein
MENDGDADYYYDEVYDEEEYDEETSWEPVIPIKPPKAVYTPFDEESGGTDDDLSYYDEDEKEVLDEEAEEDLLIHRYPYQKWDKDPRFTVCPTVKELYQWMPIAQKYHEGHFTKQQYKEMILEDINKKTILRMDPDRSEDLATKNITEIPSSLQSSCADADVPDVPDVPVDRQEETKGTNSWGSGRLQKALDIKEIVEPVVEKEKEVLSVVTTATVEQRETTPNRGPNPRMSLLRPANKNNNNHRQRDSDRQDRPDRQDRRHINNNNKTIHSHDSTVKRVSMLRPKMDPTNTTPQPPPNTTPQPPPNPPNPHTTTRFNNSNGRQTNSNTIRQNPNNSNNDRRNQKTTNNLRRPILTATSTTTTTTTTSTSSTATTTSLSTASTSTAPSSSTTTSIRKDLLCRFLATKHGPTDWEKCTRSHSMDEWVPKGCRHDIRCNRNGCGFFHKSKDTKQTYLLKLMSVENSFYHNHAEDFKKLYLK